jgi:hypothetical protein
MKKKNNPWYYYLNGSLVKKRKPAMPGDIVCVDMSLYYKLVTVHQVYIGGFHDVQKNYYDWDNVVPVFSLMAERDDARKDLEFAWDKINALKKDLDTAYEQLHEAHGIVQNLRFIISETADNIQRQLADHIKGEITLSNDKQQELLTSINLLNSLRTHINHQLTK